MDPAVKPRDDLRRRGMTSYTTSSSRGLTAGSMLTYLKPHIAEYR